MLIVPTNSRMRRVIVTTIVMIAMTMTLRIPTKKNKKKRRRMKMKKMNQIDFVCCLIMTILMILVLFKLYN